MISSTDRHHIEELGRKFGVRRILLFGSSVEANRESHDLDLAVEGIQPGLFFRFYGELISRLTKPVDLIDLSADSKFTSLVRRDGVTLYDSDKRKSRCGTREHRPDSVNFSGRK